MKGRGRRILVLGSGPIVIGQACEFDYSGTQACRALRAAGAEVILVNSNPATIMTDPSVADRTYLAPLLPEVVSRIIARERPAELLPTVGGQTALNLAVALHRQGVLERHGVRLIGAPLEAILLAEDRERFARAMADIGLRTPRWRIVHSLEEAEDALDHVGLPAIVRPSFTLGGSGGGLAFNRDEFRDAVYRGLDESPAHQVLVEESVAGWKEFELEVMCDGAGNAVVVCSIENIDPMGVHTGDSVTVAPAQTLSDVEYQRMRDAALAVIRRVGVETGGSNIQFAVDPKSGEMVVIEMNPRVSRSSALASKATGFPIAKIAAQLALGYRLDEIPNDITHTTPSSFEPVLDYVVVKVPRFDFAKFPGARTKLGPQMKSVGEVMAIGRTFREAMRKALASLELPLPPPTEPLGDATWSEARPDRILGVLSALRQGRNPAEIAEHTGIDPWFIDQFAQMVASEKALTHTCEPGAPPRPVVLEDAKREGLSDADIAALCGTTEGAVRRARWDAGLHPGYLRVDTCAGEFASRTPYFYSAWESHTEAAPSEGRTVMILGSGPNRIGQGIEFDYCCVHAAMALREAGVEAVMVNCNPETVSTDYDTSDRLYFEPLTREHVLEIARVERPEGVIVQLGGQTPLKLARGLEAAGLKILGTSPDAIDLAEDRGRFGELLEQLGIRMPPWGTARSEAAALAIAERIGYPVLVRPSYVLGGQAMRIVYSPSALERYLRTAARATPDRPVLVDKFLEDAFEYDVDALCDGKRTVIAGILEHVEEAGVHSGDSSAILPPVKIRPEVETEIRAVTRRLGEALGVRGLMNVQFAEKDGVLYVLEVNPRASRTVPFLAKATGVPLVQLATRIMLGETLDDLGLQDDLNVALHFSKVPVFPFRKFPGVDVLLGPEMRSTGEVMGVGRTPGEAFYAGLIGAGVDLPRSGTVFISVNDNDKPTVLPIAKRLADLGFRLLATAGTARYLEGHGLTVERVFKVNEGRPHVADRIRNGEVGMVVNTPLGRESYYDEKAIRLAASDHGVPCFTTLSAAEAAVEAIASVPHGVPEPVALQEL